MNTPFEKITSHKTIIRPAMLPIAGLALGLLTWIIDAIIDFYVMDEGHSLLQNLASPDGTSELWMRILILVAFILMGCFSRRVVQKHIALNNLYLDYQKNLEAQVDERTRQLEALANRDPLTNLYNRRKLSNLLSNELTRFNRYRTPFSLINIDIDHFKNINDTFGHDTGDDVIRHVSDILSSSIRDSDYAIRWGGEEFILLIIHATKQTTMKIAEKLKDTFNEIELPPVGKITVSIGVTEVLIGDTESSITRRSDRALYLAKENGRNRIETL